MDKVLSTRIDEQIAQTLDGLAITLRTSKKRIVEDAIRLYSETVEQKPDPLRAIVRRLAADGGTG